VVALVQSFYCPLSGTLRKLGTAWSELARESRNIKRFMALSAYCAARSRPGFVREAFSPRAAPVSDGEVLAPIRHCLTLRAKYVYIYIYIYIVPTSTYYYRVLRCS
jgi:hypothetical protein